MPQRCLNILYACIIILTGLGEALKLPDYQYVPDESGWLRLHILPATWADARVRCNAEGDILASPKTEGISTMMQDMMTKKEIAGVFIDIHTTLSERGFMAIDGTPISNITLKWAEGEPTNSNGNEGCLQMTSAGELADVTCSSVLPFFCLKPMTNPTEAQTVVCDTQVQGYKFEPRTGSCYKFHTDASSWYPAYMTCGAEYAHLAIINSKEESQILSELFKMYPNATITGAHYTHYAHMGFWDWSEQTEWVTIFGETMKDAGYDEWAPKEPNNPTAEICGSITRDGRLNDGYCLTRLPFICESRLNTRAPKTFRAEFTDN